MVRAEMEEMINSCCMKDHMRVMGSVQRLGEVRSDVNARDAMLHNGKSGVCPRKKVDGARVRHNTTQI